MARRKPLDQLSPAYRRRIESAERRGLSRQQARGHGTGSERAVRMARVQARAEASFRRTYELRNEDPSALFRLMLATYTVEGIVPMLRARQAAYDAYNAFPPDEAKLDAARNHLAAMHDRYRRKRRPASTHTRYGNAMPWSDFGEEEFEVAEYEDIDFDTGGGSEEPDEPYAVFLFYH